MIWSSNLFQGKPKKKVFCLLLLLLLFVVVKIWMHQLTFHTRFSKQKYGLKSIKCLYWMYVTCTFWSVSERKTVRMKTSRPGTTALKSSWPRCWRFWIKTTGRMTSTLCWRRWERRFTLTWTLPRSSLTRPGGITRHTSPLPLVRKNTNHIAHFFYCHLGNAHSKMVKKSCMHIQLDSLKVLVHWVRKLCMRFFSIRHPKNSSHTETLHT